MYKRGSLKWKKEQGPRGRATDCSATYSRSFALLVPEFTALISFIFYFIFLIFGHTAWLAGLKLPTRTKSMLSTANADSQPPDYQRIPIPSSLNDSLSLSSFVIRYHTNKVLVSMMIQKWLSAPGVIRLLCWPLRSNYSTEVNTRRDGTSHTDIPFGGQPLIHLMDRKPISRGWAMTLVCHPPERGYRRGSKPPNRDMSEWWDGTCVRERKETYTAWWRPFSSIWLIWKITLKIKT